MTPVPELISIINVSQNPVTNLSELISFMTLLDVQWCLYLNLSPVRICYLNSTCDCVNWPSAGVCHLNSSDACPSMTYSSCLSHLYFIDVCVCLTYVGQQSYLISSDAFARLTTSSRSSHFHAPRLEMKRISWSGRFLVKRFEHMNAYQMHGGKCTYDTQKVH